MLAANFKTSAMRTGYDCRASVFGKVRNTTHLVGDSKICMPGIYAAGDLTTPFLPSVTQASSQGAMAGIFAQQSMVV